MSDGDIDFLASDPPLSVYVLFEAAHDMDGRCLGALGSFIVAETLYKALQAPRRGAVPGEAGAACEFSELSRVVYGDRRAASKIARCVPNIKTIADLLEFVAPAEELSELAPSFL